MLNDQTATRGLFKGFTVLKPVRRLFVFDKKQIPENRLW